MFVINISWLFRSGIRHSGPKEKETALGRARSWVLFEETNTTSPYTCPVGLVGARQLYGILVPELLLIKLLGLLGPPPKRNRTGSIIGKILSCCTME